MALVFVWLVAELVAFVCAGLVGLVVAELVAAVVELVLVEELVPVGLFTLLLVLVEPVVPLTLPTFAAPETASETVPETGLSPVLTAPRPVRRPGQRRVRTLAF